MGKGKYNSARGFKIEKSEGRHEKNVFTSKNRIST